MAKGKKSSANRIKKYSLQFTKTVSNKQRNIEKQKKFEAKKKEKRKLKNNQ